jgi:4-carboxymuconolactone decarboxylase
MRLLAATATALSLLSSQSAHTDEATRLGSAARPAESSERSQSITVIRNGAQPSSKGSDQYFTGSVRVDPLFQPRDPSRASGAYVTFEHGATATNGMTHIAIQESLDGKNVQWMEKVSEEQYGKRAAPPGSTALPAVPTPGDVRAVSPGLERYT